VCDRVGAPHALLNSCRTGATSYARARRFGGANFVCSTMPGTSTSTGRWSACRTNNPTRPAFEPRRDGLRPAPRFENYKGMLFVNFDPAAAIWSAFSATPANISIHARFRGDDVEIVRGAGLQHEGQLENC